MKTVSYLLLALLVISVSCKPDKSTKEEEKATAKVAVTPIYSVDRTSDLPTHYYKGDTLRYSIEITADENILEYTINKNGVSLGTFDGSGKTLTHEFQYIVLEAPTEACHLTIKVKESTGLQSTHEIDDFDVIDLWEATRNSYNKQSGYPGDSMRYNFRFPKSINAPIKHVELIYASEVVINDPNYYYQNVFNTSGNFFIPADNTKPFQHVFLNSADYPNLNDFNTVVPALSSYTALTTPNQIISEFEDNYSNRNTPLTSGVNKVSVNIGDVFIIRSKQPLLSGASTTYSVVEIISIVDDNNTSDSGGNELDYIRFRIKYFSSNRF